MVTEAPARIWPLDFRIVGSNWSSIFPGVTHWFKYFAFVAQISYGLTALYIKYKNLSTNKYVWFNKTFSLYLTKLFILKKMTTFIQPSISPTLYILKLKYFWESQPSYKLFLVIAYLTSLSPVDEKTGCANLTRSWDMREFDPTWHTWIPFLLLFSRTDQIHIFAHYLFSRSYNKLMFHGKQTFCLLKISSKKAFLWRIK